MRLKIMSHAPKSDSSQVTNLCVTRQDIQSVFVPGGDPKRDLPTVSIDHSWRTGLTFTVRALSPAYLTNIRGHEDMHDRSGGGQHR